MPTDYSTDPTLSNAPNNLPEGAGQDVDENQAAVKDNFGNQYLVRRQVFGVINSPAFRALEKQGQGLPPDEGDKNTTGDGESQDEGMMPAHEPVISPADRYLEEKFPAPVSTITTQPEPTMEDEMEGRKGLWENVGKPLVEMLIGNIDGDNEAYEKWFADFENAHHRMPKYHEVPQEIWDKVQWENAEIPLDAPSKVVGLVKGGVKEALEFAASKSAKVMGFDGVGLKELIENPKILDRILQAREKGFDVSDLKEISDNPGVMKQLLDDVDEPADRAVNINLKKLFDEELSEDDVELISKINSPEDIQSVIQKTGEVFEDNINKARRGTVSWAQSEEESKTAMTLEKLLGRRVGSAYNSGEMKGAIYLLEASAKRAADLGNKIKAGVADDIDKFEAIKAYQLNYAVQAQVSGAVAEAGRTLNILKSISKNSKERMGQINDFMNNLPAGASVEDFVDMLSSYDTAEQVTKFVRDSKKATSVYMLLEAWINGLLTGPQTHVVNSTSNALFSVWQIPERLVAAGISKSKFGSGEIQAQEAMHMAYGLVEGFKDGIKAFGKVMKTGEAADVVGKIEQGGMRAITAENVRGTFIGSKFSRHLDEGTPLARAIDLWGEWSPFGGRLAGKLLQAEDALFKSIGYRIELRARAHRQAFLEGLKGEEATARMHQILTDPLEHAPDIHMDAIDMSRYVTFTDPLGEGGQKFQAALGTEFTRWNIPVFRFITPFVRTPTNLGKRTLERTPLAWAMKQYKAEIDAGGARADLARARMALGSMVAMVAGTLALEGKITGGGPSNRAMRDHLVDQGWQEYSVAPGAIFGKWPSDYLSFNRLDPVGSLFALSADAALIMSEADEATGDQIAAAVTMAISKNMTSKTYLRGFTEALNAIDDPDRYGQSYWQNFAGSFLPTAFGQIERSIAPEISAAETILDKYKSRILGLSKDLPDSVNSWGETRTAGPGGFATFLPTYISEPKDSPISAEMYALQIPMGMPSKTRSFDGVAIKMNPQQYHRFVILMNKTVLPGKGMTLKPYLNNLIKTKRYKALDEDKKRKEIRDAIDLAKSVAKEELIKEDELLQRLIEHGKTQRGIP